jgi:DHA1 family inner membrane transport protein
LAKSTLLLLIRQSFSLGLLSASWILSALNVVGLFAATPTGSICSKIGKKRAIVIGLLMIAIASTCGGFSPSLAWLLVSRLVEGIAFVMMVVAVPSLIVEAAHPTTFDLHSPDGPHTCREALRL